MPVFSGMRLWRWSNLQMTLLPSVSSPMLMSQCTTRRFHNLCSWNNLEHNALKTTEIHIDFWTLPSPHSGLKIHQWALSLRLNQDLSWEMHTSLINKKAQQRMFSLTELAKLPQGILGQFYTTPMESVPVGCRFIHRKQENAKPPSRLLRKSLATVCHQYIIRTKRRLGKIISNAFRSASYVF